MAKHMQGIIVKAIRALVTAMAIVVSTSLATGWLYLLRGSVAHWPGPRVADALPLGELPGHDGIPLIVYVAAFTVAGLALGFVARAVRLDRLTAGLALAVGAGAWLLIVDTFSLFVVRQVPMGAALQAAVRLQPVYIAAALAGAGGALLARGRTAPSTGHPRLPDGPKSPDGPKAPVTSSPGYWPPGGLARCGGVTPRLLAWLVATAGLIDIVLALIPHSVLTLGPLARFAPHVTSPAAHVLVVPAGALLLISARGLARRSKRAWRLAAGLLGLSVLLQVLRGPGYIGAIVTGLVAVALLARREAFPFTGDPTVRPSATLRLAGTLLFTLGYGMVALWAYRSAANLPYGPAPALLDTLRAMGGQLPRDVDLLPGDFAEWLPLSVLSIAAIGVVWTAAVWLRPWRQRLFPDMEGHKRAADIVRRWGHDTLAPFALRSDKQWFVTGETLIAYRVIRGIALVSGDPVGPPDSAGPALASFLAYAQTRGWHTAVMGASGRMLRVYRDQGLHSLYHGDEAVLDPARFSLDGRRMRTVRQAAHRLQRRGFRAEVVTAGEITPELRAELTAVEHAWLRGAARKGFTMELDSLFGLGGDEAVFVIGRDDLGNVQGFLHLAVCQAGRSLSLSTMPRWRDAPNGLTAWLIVEAVSWARSDGFRRLSLNFSPFAGLLAAPEGLSAWQRFQRRALLRLKDALALQLDNLLQFNGQFDPAWQPRYVIIERWADLPRMAMAAMAAEGYLPRSGLIRGRGWSPATGKAKPPEACPVPAAPELATLGGRHGLLHGIPFWAAYPSRS
jgi:lysyl-tRNA synthetase, class II